MLVQKGQKARGDELEALRRFHDGELGMKPERPSARPHPLALEWHRDVRFGKAA